MPDPYCPLNLVTSGDSQGTGTGPAGFGGGAAAFGGTAGGASLSLGGTGSTEPDCLSAPGFCSLPGGGGEGDFVSSGRERTSNKFWRTLTSNSLLLLCQRNLITREVMSVTGKLFVA